jgi:hypothetical protein
MKLEVSKVDIWQAKIEDRPGALAEKLAALADAGADLEFVLARRTRDEPGGVVYLASLKGAKQTKAAAGVGLAKSADMAGLRVEAGNVPGLAAKLSRAMADAGINLRGFVGTAVGKNSILFLALDNADDAAKATKALKALAKA